MMKKALSLCLFLIIPVISSSAQGDRLSGINGAFEFRHGAINLGNSGMRPYEFMAGIGYNFSPTIFLRADAELSIGLYKKDDRKTYIENGTLGATVGVNVLKYDSGRLTLTGSAGNTIGGSDWTFLYCDLGLRWSFRGNGKMSPYIGAGVRYYDSHKDAFKDYVKGYAAVGVRFN